MKTYAHFIITLIFLSRFTPAYNQTIIGGQITDIDGWSSVLYLSHLNEYRDVFSGSDALVIDSAVIQGSGHFTFPPNLYKPGWYRLNIQQSGAIPKAGMLVGVPFENYIHLYLDASPDQVIVQASAAKLNWSYQITGNQESLLAQSIRNIRSPLFQVLDSTWPLFKNFETLTPEKQQEVRGTAFQIINPAARKMQVELRVFLDSITNINAGLLGTCYYNLGDDYTQYAPFFDSLVRKWEISAPENPYLKSLKEEVNQFIDFLPVGSLAPDFILPGIDGKTIRLNEVKAKLLLVDFWASWCGPCRIENRETVLPLYKRFKQEGFIVLGVSLDTNKKKWQDAVQKEAYPSIQVSDLKGTVASEVASLYKIRSVPTTYLLDEHKHILAKDLRGYQLIEFVQNYLKDH